MLDTGSPQERAEDTRSGPEWDPGELRLTVLCGHHSGATLAISASGVALIGSGADADIILMDPGVAAAHLSMTCHADRIHLRAEEGILALGADRAARRLAPGEAASLALPARFCLIADTDWQIEIEVAEAPSEDSHRPPRRGFGRWIRWSGIACAAACALVVMNGHASFPSVPDMASLSVSDLRAARGTEPAVPPVAAPMPGLAPSETVQAEAEEDLRARLKDAALEMLEVAPSAGVIEIKGELTPAEMQIWRAVNRAYDRSFGSRVPVSTNLTLIERPFSPPKKPTGIWLGETPYIIDAKGIRRKVGQTTSDGWQVVRISEGELLLERDDRKVSVALLDR
ncbi:MAG: FHA domain-containing protein [Pseudomonadota bacterium]